MNSVKILHAVRSAITAIAELLVLLCTGGPAEPLDTTGGTPVEQHCVVCIGT